jgi:DNA-binding CsgD family transcriptional regulator
MTFQELYYFSDEQKSNVLSNIYNKINAFICIIDIQYEKLIWANRHFIHNLGYPGAKLLTMTTDELLAHIHPDYREIQISSFKDLIFSNNECSYSLIKLLTRGNIWTLVLNINIAYERNYEGHITKVLIYSTEVDIDQLQDQLSLISKKENSVKEINCDKHLSIREKKIIELISKGATDRNISVELGISINTAKTHRKRIIHKLGLKNSCTLIKYAIDNGLC